jgi:hypothetical protein
MCRYWKKSNVYGLLPRLPLYHLPPHRHPSYLFIEHQYGNTHDTNHQYVLLLVYILSKQQQHCATSNTPPIAYWNEDRK